ncbi:LCP family protein [Streptomyces sp. HNM0663]|uniref:LCP family protein n=1 Tax=Streptomyces chengmaiensis TaxID=3040919 RepID=A0ABT6HMD7_9ACTN|nr:LCP family protein [Streptomyces chengmaiensis]MDH2389880.1 LCP family protein [Streptomyces chengmaiensis]
MPTPPRPRRQARSAASPSPSPRSRGQGGGRGRPPAGAGKPGARPRPRPQPRPGPRRPARRPRWGLRAATALSVLVLGAGGIGHAIVTGLDAGLDRIDPFKDMKNRPEAGHGLNILLVGTDDRDKIGRDEKVKYRLGGAPCNCTDTIMLVHISEDRGRASVVSLPRDSYAEIPEHTDLTSGERHRPHPVKLNAVYAEGGPQLTVRTVEHMTKVKIDHYLEVDFTSFMKTVDVLGGVEICTARPLKDSHTGLELAAGTHRMDGGQALQYVRSRHVDGAADLGRMERQQRFLAALAAQAADSGVLLNPVRFRDVASTVLRSVRADKGFGTEQMLALGKAMRGFTPASSEFTTVPVGDHSFPVKGIGSTVKWDPAKAKRIFRALRDDKPLASPPSGGPPKAPEGPRPALVDVPPRQIRVQVYNGTHTDGLGRKADAELRAVGFATTRAPLNGASREVKRTSIAYDPRWDRSAKTLAAALPGAELRAVKGQGATLRVTLGADFKRVTPVRAEDPQRSELGAVTGDQVVCP